MPKLPKHRSKKKKYSKNTTKKAEKVLLLSKKHIFCHYSVLEIEELAIRDKILLSHIISYNIKGKDCFTSISVLAEVFACKPHSISRSFSKLVKEGWITRQPVTKIFKGKKITLWHNNINRILIEEKDIMKDDDDLDIDD